MTTAAVIAAELQARGFTSGLIRGFFQDGGEKWGREMRRCKTDGDATDLAKDIAAVMEMRRGTKLRAHDYRCERCRSNFEAYLSYNPYDLDELEVARTAAHACPHCQSLSRPVILKAPGMHVAPWVMQFGGQNYDKDSFDAHADALLNPPKPKRFYEESDFGQKFDDALDETAIQTANGSIPSSPQIDPSQAEEIAAAITKGV